MSGGVTVIDIIAQVTDDTGAGARSAMEHVSKLEKAMQKAQDEIKRMKGMSKIDVAVHLKDLASKGLKTIADTGKRLVGKAWNITVGIIDKVTAPLRGIWNMLSNPIVAMAGAAGISLGAKEIIQTYMDMEQGMANVKAILGATDTEMAKLNDTAKSFTGSIYSANDAVGVFQTLAGAGWGLDQINDATDAILKMATAGDVLPEVAANAMQLARDKFGGSYDGIADTFAAASGVGQYEIPDLISAFTEAAPMAAALGYSLEDTATALELMAKSGAGASTAGNALNSMMARMAKQGELTGDEEQAVAVAMNKIGVSLYDASGKSKPFNKVLGDLRKGFKNLTEAERNQYGAILAGTNYLPQFMTLMNASQDEVDGFTDAITNSTGAAQKMADIKTNTLQGTLAKIKSGFVGIGNAVSEKLAPYLRSTFDWITTKLPSVQTVAGDITDFVVSKIEAVKTAITTLTSSGEWSKAETLWDKIKVAWDKLIAEPFDAWWNGAGKAWLAEKAEGIGKGIGTALKTGILTLLGVKTGDALTEGADIGRSFMEGFLQGFDGKVVADAIKGAIKGIFSDAATLLPGGEDPTSTSGLSAALVGYGALKVGRTAWGIGKGVNTVVKGGQGIYRALTGTEAAAAVPGAFKTGASIFKAGSANGAGSAAQSAATFAQAGKLGGGVKFGANVAKVGSKAGAFAGKAIPILGGIMALAEMGMDAKEAYDTKAEEWLGDDSTGSKIAAGAGAFLGGTGPGVTDKNASGWDKAKNIGGGALKGAAIGAAIGTIIPGVGTAIGAAVGAGVGALTSAIGGENIAKFFKAAGTTIADFFSGPFVDFFKWLWDGIKTFFTETIPNAVGAVGNALKTFFTETVPNFFQQLWDGVVSFFTQTVPYALGFIAGKVVVFFTETVPAALETIGAALGVFFTETVPNFFTGLWNGAVEFFTVKVPAALEVVGEALGVFFTETVPNFFGDVWAGVTTFFTEKVPAALTAIGTALTTFFTEDIPKFFSDLWSSITNLVTVEIPKAAAAVGASITTFFTESIPQFFGDVWDNVKGFFGGIGDWFSKGYNDATAHADGGILTKPHFGLVAEDGAEAVIPLSGKRRQRGIDLWEQAGEMLGVKPYAEGAVIGVAQGSGGGEASAVTVPVTIDKVSFDVHVTGGDAPDAENLVAVIKENVKNLTDEIAYQIAMSLQQVFANMPLANRGV